MFANICINRAKKLKTFLTPFLLMGFILLTCAPFFAFFNLLWGGILLSISVLSFLGYNLTHYKIDSLYNDASLSIEKEEERNKRIEEVEAKAEERRQRLAKDPYCEVVIPAKLILSVMALLYEAGVDIYTDNIYRGYMSEINANLNKNNLNLSKATKDYLKVILKKNDVEYLTLNIPRYFDKSSLHIYRMQIQDQYGNMLYDIDNYKFCYDLKDIINNFRSNWSNSKLVDVAYNLVSSISKAEEEAVQSRMAAPDLQETLRQVENEGFNHI